MAIVQKESREFTFILRTNFVEPLFEGDFGGGGGGGGF